jgi:hypothetical protein
MLEEEVRKLDLDFAREKFKPVVVDTSSFPPNFGMPEIHGQSLNGSFRAPSMMYLHMDDQVKD